jgi:hypothetical protein
MEQSFLDTNTLIGILKAIIIIILEFGRKAAEESSQTRHQRVW